MTNHGKSARGPHTHKAVGVFRSWIVASYLLASGCADEPVKDGGLCNADDECENENCGPGVCSSSAVCSSDDDCDPEAYCRATYNYCARPCSAGCGNSTCIDSLGICDAG